jgi:hypothetical protein
MFLRRLGRNHSPLHRSLRGLADVLRQFLDRAFGLALSELLADFLGNVEGGIAGGGGMHGGVLGA